MKQGVQQGKLEGEQALTLRLLQKRFGELDARIQAKIRALSLPRLEQLGEALLDFQKREDLRKWLREHAK